MKHTATVTGFTVVMAVTLFLSPKAASSETILYEYDSVYHHIRVVQEGSIRAMRFDNNFFQSKMDVNNPVTGYFGYIGLLFQAFVYEPEPESVLFLGLGGGSAQKIFNYYQPDLEMLTVELDPAVVVVAEEFFYYDPDEMPVVASDARDWLRRSDGTFDMIIQDTYSSNVYGTFIPFHLATLEFFTLVKERLSDDGVFAINVIGTVYGGESNRVIDSVYKTMHQVFPQIYMFPASDEQNVVLIATKSQARLSGPQLAERARTLMRERPDEFPGDLINGTMRYIDGAPGGLGAAMILTDDFSPTDNLLR